MRTHCITIDLANQGRRQVRARFDGGRMSSDGGALLLQAVDQRIGLTQNARQQREVCSPCANSPSRTGRVPRNRSRLTQIWLREGIPERQGQEISCRPASNSPLPGPVTPKSEAA